MNLLALFKKYRSMILYIVFGIITTIVNMGVYWFCYNVTGIANLPSTIIAWFAAVVIAYATNKVWVFDSRSFAPKVLIYELITFFACRILTGLLDVAIMYMAVDMMQLNGIIFKFISNVLVIILNFIASKLVIFIKK